MEMISKFVNNNYHERTDLLDHKRMLSQIWNAKFSKKPYFLSLLNPHEVHWYILTSLVSLVPSTSGDIGILSVGVFVEKLDLVVVSQQPSTTEDSTEDALKVFNSSFVISTGDVFV